MSDTALSPGSWPRLEDGGGLGVIEPCTLRGEPAVRDVAALRPRGGGPGLLVPGQVGALCFLGLCAPNPSFHQHEKQSRDSFPIDREIKGSEHWTRWPVLRPEESAQKDLQHVTWRLKETVPHLEPKRIQSECGLSRDLPVSCRREPLAEASAHFPDGGACLLLGALASRRALRPTLE